MVKKVLREAVGVAFELLEIELAGIVELLAGRFLNHLVDIGGTLAFQFLCCFRTLSLVLARRNPSAVARSLVASLGDIPGAGMGLGADRQCPK